MRRLTFAGLSAALLLSACSDQPREPTSPEAVVGGACQVTPFPHSTVVAQVKDVFSPSLRGQAVSRSAAIKNDWNGCRPDPARQLVVEFVGWMNLRFLAGELIGTEQQRSDLIKTLFEGVGLTAPPSFGLGPDFGVGVFDPNNPDPTLVTTEGGTALTELPPGAFDELTLIVIGREADDSDPLNTELNQFPPFFDYTAVNSSGTRFLEEGFAIIGFCLLLENAELTYPEFANARIGHNPPPEDENNFEILDRVDLEPEGERGDLGDILRENCGNLQPNLAIGGFGGGLRGFAGQAWRSTTQIARAIFLPQPLRATTVGYGGPIGGKTTSLSPFGVVEVEEEIEYGIEQTTSPQLGDEEASDGPYYVGQPLDTCEDSCYPRFRVTTSEGVPAVELAVSVALEPEEGSEGSLLGTTTRNTDGEGFVRFDDLRITNPGEFRLVVTASGASQYMTGFFTVQEVQIEFSYDGDPSERSFFENSPLSWEFCIKACYTTYPKVQVTSGEDGGVSNVDVVVELIPSEGSTGTFTTGEEGSITTVTTDGDGMAVFDALSITDDGDYSLRFSIPGTEVSVVSDEFTVYAYQLEFISDPSDQDMEYPFLRWYCGGPCYPEVRLVNGAGEGVDGVEVSVELIQMDGSGEIDTESSTTTVTTSSGEGTGYALFDDLSITAPGYYGLRFTAPGAADLESQGFNASDND